MNHPLDTLALKFAHDSYFYLGHSAKIRDSIARVLPHYKESNPFYGYDSFVIHMSNMDLCKDSFVIHMSNMELCKDSFVIHMSNMDLCTNSFVIPKSNMDPCTDSFAIHMSNMDLCKD